MSQHEKWARNRKFMRAKFFLSGLLSLPRPKLKVVTSDRC
ncbi:hypothetical protein IFVP182_C1200298 [Vibrio parahaemolyticus]